MRQGTATPPTLAGPRRTAREELTDAMKAFQAKPSYAAYSALILHYSHCPACADGTDPCAEGEPLRQAWKAVRWS